MLTFPWVARSTALSSSIPEKTLEKCLGHPWSFQVSVFHSWKSMPIKDRESCGIQNSCPSCPVCCVVGPQHLTRNLMANQFRARINKNLKFGKSNYFLAISSRICQTLNEFQACCCRLVAREETCIQRLHAYHEDCRAIATIHSPSRHKATETTRMLGTCPKIPQTLPALKRQCIPR